MKLSPSTWSIQQELERRGYNTLALEETLILVEIDGAPYYFRGSRTFTQNSVSYAVTKNKHFSKQFFHDFHFQTAKYRKITKETIDLVDELQFPVVVKPLDLSGGRGVEVGIRTKERILDYLERHPEFGKEFLVEEIMVGIDYRILLIKGKYYATITRVPPAVIGDGEHTIKELITTENVRREQLQKRQEARQVYDAFVMKIPLTHEVRLCLREQGRRLKDIPSKGEEVAVRRNANVSTGGRTVDMTQIVHPTIIEQCERMCKELSMPTLGIDIMTPDITRPLHQFPNAGYIEINASPAIQMCSFDHIGKRYEAAKEVVDDFLEYIGKK